MNILKKKVISFSISIFFLASLAFSQPSTEWPSHSYDPAGSRYSPLEQVHQGNAAQLKRAWTYRTGDIAPGSRHYFECTPLMVEGVVYVITTFSRLAAMDATTGKELWTFTPDPPLETSETGGGGLASRGVSYWESGDKKRIFLPVRDGRLYSIDITTHKPDPDFGSNGVMKLRDGLPEDGRFLFLSSPPAIYQDLVIQGFGINDSASRYIDVPLRAYDVHTGEVRWSFNTVPQGDEFGADTWKEESWRSRGGCNVWSLMSVDTENGIVYLPTGAPNFDKFGGDRIGKNLFGNSLVALNAKTGERIWHQQLVHHDVWDYDMPALPNLVDLTVDGKIIPAVAIVGKTGFVYIFNRLTGEPVFPIEERPVPQSDIEGELTYETQPFPSKPPAFSRQHLTQEGLHNLDPKINAALREELTQYRSTGVFTPPSLQGTIVYPGQLGGANWSGAAVSPDGMLYVNANELAYIVKLIPAPDEEMGYGARAVHFLDRNGLPAVAPPWGTLTRIDLNAGEIDWQKPLGEHPKVKNKSVQPTGTMNFGGATVTAGNIVLIASTMDECFRVFDAKTGEVLFQEKMEAAGYGAPITYLGKDGNQYIVICAGGGGKAMTPAGDYVIAFTLNQE